jgi:hypothetical protein
VVLEDLVQTAVQPWPDKLVALADHSAGQPTAGSLRTLRWPDPEACVASMAGWIGRAPPAEAARLALLRSAVAVLAVERFRLERGSLPARHPSCCPRLSR